MKDVKKKTIPDKYLDFALLLIISNKMNTLLDRDLKELNVTSKQWFLSETIKSIFSDPPTMKKLAHEMGSSHQNVKQVALKLQQKGLLLLEKDKKDARTTRLLLTENSYDFLKKADPKGKVFMEKMFKGMKIEDIRMLRSLLEKMLSNLREIDSLGTKDVHIA